MAQIGGRNSIGWAERLDLDLDYLNRASLLLDLQVLLRTVGYLVGSRAEPTTSTTAFSGADSSIKVGAVSSPEGDRREYNVSTAMRSLADAIALHLGLLAALWMTNTTQAEWSAVINVLPATVVTLFALLAIVDPLRLGSRAYNGALSALALESLGLVLLVMALTRSAYGPVAAALAIFLGVLAAFVVRLLYRLIFPVAPSNILLVASGFSAAQEDEDLICDQLEGGGAGKLLVMLDSPGAEPSFDQWPGYAVVLSPWLNPERRSAVAGLAHEAGCSVRVIPSAYEIAIASAPTRSFNDLLALDVNFLKVPTLSYRILKRVCDLAISIVVLLAAALPLAILLVIIRSTSPGAALYRQERVGRNGQKFEIMKLRTMRQDAEANGAVLAEVDDPRITPLGRFLRRSRIDELPQLVNVVRGEMSIVGPRPERPEFVDQFKRTISGYENREVVRPGLTGLAQVRGRYATTAASKLRYDLYYIRYASLFFDLQIILETFGAVMRSDSATGITRRIPDQTLQKHESTEDVQISIEVTAHSAESYEEDDALGVLSGARRSQ